LFHLDRQVVRFVDGLQGDRTCPGLRPDYLITDQYFLPGWRYWSDDVRSFVTENYDLTKAFIALDPRAKGNVFDRQDRFYLPFAGFHGVARPGPNLYVYRLKQPPGMPSGSVGAGQPRGGSAYSQTWPGGGVALAPPQGSCVPTKTPVAARRATGSEDPMLCPLAQPAGLPQRTPQQGATRPSATPGSSPAGAGIQ
jgi:hypothetical protein